MWVLVVGVVGSKGMWVWRVCILLCVGANPKETDYNVMVIPAAHRDSLKASTHKCRIHATEEDYKKASTSYLGSAPGLGSVLRAAVAMDDYKKKHGLVQE